MIDSGRPLLELEQLAAWATVRLLLNEPRLGNQRLAWLWRLFFGIIGEMSRVVAALTKEGEMK